MVIKQICRDADKKPASVIRLFRSGLFICLLCVMASCSSLAPSVTSSNMSATITPSVKVEITALTALAEGMLIKTDGCIKIRSKNTNDDFFLVWPPDFAVMDEGDSVKVTSGIVTGRRNEVTLFIGEQLSLGGGSIGNLSEALQKTIPGNCNGPYWVVGSVVSHYVPTPSDIVPPSTPTSGSIAKPTDPATTVTINLDQAEVNLRGGPGTTYSRVGTLKVGEKVQAFGKSQGGDWIEVNFPPGSGGKAWVFSSLVTISGNELPVVDSNGSLITAATPGQTYNSMPLDSRVVKAIRIFGQQQGVNIYYVGKTDFIAAGPDQVKIVDQYNVDGFIYDIDPLTYRVVNYHISPVQPVNGRTYSEDELEKMALQFVMAQIPGIQLQDLSFEKGNKGGNFFFRWSKSASGQGYFECVQVGYSLYGQLFDYVDSLPTDVIQ